MKCPFCQADTKVTNKRDTDTGTRRRRECLKCKKRFTTYESIEFKSLRVIKKDGNREPFDKEKVTKGLLKACEKRPVSIEKIENTVQSIEAKLRSSNKKEVKAEKIGEIIMKSLKKLDKVAYIRFASVYRDFQDLSDFKKEIRGLK